MGDHHLRDHPTKRTKEEPPPGIHRFIPSRSRDRIRRDSRHPNTRRAAPHRSPHRVRVGDVRRMEGHGRPRGRGPAQRLPAEGDPDAHRDGQPIWVGSARGRA